MIKIDSPEANELVQELIGYTGETTPQAIVNALRERLAREKAKQHRRRSVKDEVLRIGRECADLPVVDPGSPEEILGYDQHGLPH